MLKHFHVNTENGFAFQHHLLCFKSVFNSNKHGLKDGHRWLKFAVAGDEYC